MQKSHIYTLDINILYIFFENHKHSNKVAKLFGSYVSKDALKIYHLTKSHLQVVNHIGFLFFDTSWNLAELNYFAGGRVVRELNFDEIENLQIYPIMQINNEIKKSIYSTFVDKLQTQNYFYSLRRYNFWKCNEYIKNSHFKRPKLFISPLLFILGIISKIKPNINAGWTCIEIVFFVLNINHCNPFAKKLSPYELLLELDFIYKYI